MPAERQVTLPTDPEPLEIDLSRTAVIIVDMQNAFVSKGGMFELAGKDTSRAQQIIKPIRNVLEAARANGIKVIHFAYRYSPDLRETGGPDSAIWKKHIALTMLREHPEWQDKLLIRGTWGAEIIDELKPGEGEIFIEKWRFSGFFKTNLDVILNTLGIKYLLFTGVVTNGCVQASMIDAYSLGYFPILISDATTNSGPPICYEATVYNVNNAYGWVITAKQAIEGMQG